MTTETADGVIAVDDTAVVATVVVEAEVEVVGVDDGNAARIIVMDKISRRIRHNTKDEPHQIMHPSTWTNTQNHDFSAASPMR